MNQYTALSRRLPEHHDYGRCHVAGNGTVNLTMLQQDLVAALKTSIALNVTVERLNRDIATLQEALDMAQNMNIAFNATSGNRKLGLEIQKVTSAYIPQSGVVLKAQMTRSEWISFVSGQLRSTSNFSAAMYARWSRYMNKEWINDEYKSSTPKAMLWDNCMNGREYCVISMALYAHEVSYLDWIRKRLPLYRDAMDIFYPGWRLRIHHDESVSFSVLESVAARGAETILVTDFKGQIAGMFWRFYVADDLDVDRYIVRDIDSDFNWRERSAVDEWIRSNVSFHSMADAENHNVPIMGGMWGGSSKRRLPFSVRAKVREFQHLAASKGGDQDFLAAVIWPAWQESG
jgi:hypothetical protein